METPISKESIHILNILGGLDKSEYNFVLFKDTPELLMQYYMGLYLKKPTIVVVRKEDEKKARKMLIDPLVKEIIITKDFSQATVAKVAKQLEKILKGKN